MGGVGSAQPWRRGRLSAGVFGLGAFGGGCKGLRGRGLGGARGCVRNPDISTLPSPELKVSYRHRLLSLFAADRSVCRSFLAALGY